MTFELNSPFQSLEFERAPRHWKAIMAGWMLLWLAVVLAIGYAYVVVLPAYVGFERAVLIGIAVAALTAAN